MWFCEWETETVVEGSQYFLLGCLQGDDWRYCDLEEAVFEDSEPEDCLREVLHDHVGETYAYATSGDE